MRCFLYKNMFRIGVSLLSIFYSYNTAYSQHFCYLTSAILIFRVMSKTDLDCKILLPGSSPSLSSGYSSNSSSSSKPPRSTSALQREVSVMCFCERADSNGSIYCPTSPCTPPCRPISRVGQPKVKHVSQDVALKLENFKLLGWKFSSL